jgi:hypothetical protein
MTTIESAPSPAGAIPGDPLNALPEWCDAIAAMLGAHARAVAAVTFAALLVITAGRARLMRWRHTRLATHARLIDVLPPPTADLAGAETLWTVLLGLLRPRRLRALTGVPHMAWEYCFSPDGVRIRLWVPGSVPPGLIERAVQGAWPGAATRTIRAMARQAVPVGCLAVGGRMRLGRPDHYPLHHDATGADPLRALLSSAGGLGPGEHAVVQMLARPVTGRRLRRATRYATRLRTPGAAPGVRSALFDLLPVGATPQHRPVLASARPADVPAEVRAILAKASRPRLETVIRYTVTTTDTSPRGRDWARGRAHAIASAFSVHTGTNHLRRRRLRHPTTAAGERRMRRGDLLSVPELAALCHLPVDDTVPGLARAGARSTAPPPVTPAGGPGVRILGDADAGPGRPVGIRVADARHHTHVIGETGAGKTTGLLSMQLSDAEAERGFVSIEPKGDSALLLSRLPERCTGTTVVIDPADDASPPCLNILDGTTPELTADMVVGIFRRIYSDFWGPRTDDILRSTILTACLRPGATLADIPRLLGNDTYRAALVAQVTNPFLLDFWGWYDNLSPAMRGQVTGPVMNKLRAVLLRGFARDVLTAGPTTIDIGHLLDTGGILIARLPKGVLGEDTARLLGSLVLAKTWQAVQARAHRPEHRRRDCGIYIDECHNFLTLPHGLDDMLAEARSYHAGLVLAHQNLTQLPTDLREALAANARNKIFFTVSPADATRLERHLEPNLSTHDLANLDAFQAAARLLHNGALTPAFTFRTRRLPPPIPGREKAIRQASQARFGHKPASETSRPFTGDPRHPS